MTQSQKCGVMHGQKNVGQSDKHAAMSLIAKCGLEGVIHQLRDHLALLESTDLHWLVAETLIECVKLSNQALQKFRNVQNLFGGQIPKMLLGVMLSFSLPKERHS